ANRTGTTATPFGYSGGEQYQSDAQSGLMLLGNRYYDSSVGRFISRDPAKSGSNWFAYCGNNPLNRSDPNGLAYICDDGDLAAHGKGIAMPFDDGRDWFDHTGDFSCGMANGLSCGLIGNNPFVDQNSGWYKGGILAGAALQAAIGAGAGAVAAEAKGAGAVAAEAKGAAELAEAAEQSFFRVAESTEMESIATNHAILPSPNGSEVKYFWGSAEEAEQYANMIKSRGWCENPSIIETHGPGHLFDGPRMMDGISGGYTIPIEHLPRLSPPIIIK
ncbi:MAG: RHS repeat-associated core domain-containing protein, partial [Armatimonadetes bacterium]|nr:RHS repeat-associated core domain-containing protein [Armatimonadota bacterium]